MFRKIGFHRSDESDQDANDVSSREGLEVELPEHTHKPQSDSSAVLLNSVPSRPKHGRSHNSISTADSAFPSLERSKLCKTQSEDPLGLHLVYTCSNPMCNIIFVHGLGGTSKKTWSWERNSENFWPTWLADDGLSTCRIFTFGYNSNFKGAATNLTILDFAKELLFEMLTFTGDHVGGHISVAQTPIIFVAHSMGGLVVKKAYILGRSDTEYADIISNVYGIVFLATPHRGAQYAKMLNHILSTAPLGAPPKAYIADLDTQSSALQDINEQFRTLCNELSLFSFFETRKTSFGLTKLVIVEKESGILGYPQETSSPLNADHHTICKFTSQEDPKYRSVKNILKLWVGRIIPSRPSNRLQGCNSNVDSKREINRIMGIRERPQVDLDYHRSRATSGTCKWITQRHDFIHWVVNHEMPNHAQVYWLLGPPATGKTTIASVVTDEIQLLGHRCAYHFFSEGHQTKRKAAFCLRSIASQLASSHDDLRQRLIDMGEEPALGSTLRSDNFQELWDRIFEGLIFKVRFDGPLFWILDSVDEADHQSFLIDKLIKAQALTPIKIFLTSRPIRLPSAPSSLITSCFLTESKTIGDIRLFIQNAIKNALPHDEQLQEEIINQMLMKAEGSFLWVKLALDTLQSNWHTQEDIRQSLTEIPTGMEDLYARMLHGVKQQPPRLRFMACRILTWAACSWRPLNIDELRIALEPDFKNFVNLKDTILQICGHFIALSGSKISLIHSTARDFLVNDRPEAPAFVDSQSGHEHLASVCLQHLSTDSWRQVFKAVDDSATKQKASLKVNRLVLAEKNHPFLGYATCYWAYHISKSGVNSERLFETLNEFLTKHCLSWVEAIALSSNLLYMTRAVKYLKAYTRKRLRYLKYNTSDTLQSLEQPSEDESASFRIWANDLIRIIGKFGSNLVRKPSAIYKLVPPFCPTSSMVGLHYGLIQNKSIAVTGLSSNAWDDCLASVSVGEDGSASKILASSAFFLSLMRNSGTVVIWNAETFEEVRRLMHGEYVSTMALNKSGEILATAGIDHYRVWDVSSGKEINRLPTISHTFTMAIALANNGSELYIGLDDCSVVRIDLGSGTETQRVVLRDPYDPYLACPSAVAFKPDLTKIAMAWRGKPPLIWDITSEGTKSPYRYSFGDSTESIRAPEILKWQSDCDSLLILCQDTVVVEWRPDYDEQVTFDHLRCRELTVSQDGNLLLTSDSVGTISLWTFPKLDLIYRLINDNAFIKDLTFSPDGQRFYDSRGSICNVWEPDVLLRPDERDTTDRSSVAESSTVSEPIITHDESSRSAVTALACDRSDAYYCCGREDGTVIIHDSLSGQKIRKVYTHASTSSVIILSWSPSGKYMVSGDDSGRIIAKRLEAKEAGKWAVFPVFDIRLDESVQQFLFDSSEQLLLISTSTKDLVWGLKAKKELCRESWGFRQNRRWIEHPRDSKLLLWIDPDTVRTFEWETLRNNKEAERRKNKPVKPSPPGTPTTPTTPIAASCRTGPPAPNDSSKRIVQWLDITHDKRYLIYETLPDTGHISSRSTTGLHLEILSASDLHTECSHPHSFISECVADLEGQVKRLVGTYKDRIMFLDQDYWVCTWRIEAGLEDIRRHFFLPKDWLNAGTLQMAMVNNHGTFLCPKHGDVGVVRGGMRFGLEPAF